MSRLSHTAKITLSISKAEFLRTAKPLIEWDLLKVEIKRELYQCCQGIISGEWGGGFNDDWKEIFFHQLKKYGHIEFTDYGKSLYE